MKLYPPPKKGKFFRGQKNLNSPVGSENMMRTPTFEKRVSDPGFFFFFFGCCCQNFCHADVNSREQQAILLKKTGIFSPKLRLSCFSGERFGTILQRRSRLSRTSRAPSRLSRPRPIDCNSGYDRQMNIFLFLCFNIAKNTFLSRPLYSPDLHLKRSPLPDFRDRGSVFARQC